VTWMFVAKALVRRPGWLRSQRRSRGFGVPSPPPSPSPQKSWSEARAAALHRAYCREGLEDVGVTWARRAEPNSLATEASSANRPGRWRATIRRRSMAVGGAALADRIQEVAERRAPTKAMNPEAMFAIGRFSPPSRIAIRSSPTPSRPALCAAGCTCRSVQGVCRCVSLSSSVVPYRGCCTRSRPPTRSIPLIVTVLRIPTLHSASRGIAVSTGGPTTKRMAGSELLG
jgi:hypothetical protein